jgi:hypothetical protein
MDMGTLSHARITVTQRHIDEAVPGHSGKCMVAEAIKDAIPGAMRADVDMQTMRFTDRDGVRRTYLTPGAAQQALVRFDAGDPVRPFAFNLPAVMHISRPTKQTKGNGDPPAETTRSKAARARIGGRPMPSQRSTTRRAFGIRRLRINQQGQVEQTGLIDVGE